MVCGVSNEIVILYNIFIKSIFGILMYKGGSYLFFFNRLFELVIL